jgi:hypothetical protein
VVEVEVVEVELVEMADAALKLSLAVDSLVG